jgi:peptidoglycan/LPS O-acetylase OafA/YrhL
MPQSRQPLFLARANYRRRRLRDGARMLPFFGLILLMLPMFWPEGQRMVTLHWAYLFLIWAALIAVAAVLAGKLVDGDMTLDLDADIVPDLPPAAPVGQTPPAAPQSGAAAQQGP